MSATEQSYYHDDNEIDDATLVAMAKEGAALGVPLVFGIALLISLPGAGWPVAPLIAVLPALFAGPWLGMTIKLLTRRPVAAAVLASPRERGAAAPGSVRPPLDRAA